MNSMQQDSVETRENIPLKQSEKPKRWWKCNPSNDDYLSEPKFINIAFTTLTVIITIALLLQIYYGDYQVLPHGSVATDSFECSKIGTSVLKKGGNAVDATIASAFCLAVIAPHLTSLDAGGELLIYNHRERLLPVFIDFSISDVGTKILPRLVVGLGYIHQQYGSKPWKDLIEPAINLARQGILVTKTLVQAITLSKSEHLYGRLEPGQLLQLNVLADTLQTIADLPEEDLYQHIHDGNPPYHSKAMKGSFNNFDIYIPDFPTVGPLLLRNLDKLQQWNFTEMDSKVPEYTYRLAEVTQILYNDFNVTSQYHQGPSSNIAAMDLNDNYVSFITGFEKLFGSGDMTDDGYILDIRQKTVQNSRLPIIITDANAICGRRLIFGAGSLDIATQIIMQLLIAKQNLTIAVEAPRYHLLTNGSIGIESHHIPAFSDDILKYLETLTPKPVSMQEPYFSSNVVEKVKDDLNSHSDSRGGGISSRF